MSLKPSAMLLPNGLVDFLPPQAELEAATIETFMRDFSAFGYARVKPPLVEFEESLLAEGPGQALSRKTFRLMDPLSQRMMGVRADMTSQIARIANSRLGAEDRPLRLSYAGDVLRVNGTQLRPERQFCQVGCELIGEDSQQADIEVALIAIKALSGANIKALSIDLTVPTLIENIYIETGASEDERAVLDDLIEKRDEDALANEKGNAAKLIAQLTGVEGTADRASITLSAINLPAKAAADIEKLLAVAKGLREALSVYGLDDVQITIDPLERRGFEYQTGSSFTLFAKGARGELGRGGRYNVSQTGETATGFTLYMDSILRVVPAKEGAKQAQESAISGWGAIKSLQDKGFSVLRKD
jgi:ATP phosphoribosyltransferase regulatory subunit